MYLEDSFIKRYYQVSLIFIGISLVEGILYVLDIVTFVNFVYLLFEVIWLFFSFVIFIYIWIEKHPKPLLILPLLYLMYFVASFVYIVIYGISLADTDKEIFIKNNGFAIICFALIALIVMFVIWRKFFRKIL